MSDESDHAVDFGTGQNIAAGGGSPDWNNESQVAGYYAQQAHANHEAFMNAQNQYSSTTHSNSSDDSMTWGLPSSGYSSGSYSGTSLGRGNHVTGSGMAIFLGLILGGYGGYSFASSYHGTSLELWLTTGGAALGAAFLCHLLAEVIKGTMSLSVAVGTVILAVSGFVSGVLGYWYAEGRHRSTAELWLAAALAALGAVFLLAFVAKIFKGKRTLFTLGSILAMVLGGYSGHTYYDGTPLQDWLAGGVGALIVGFCAWLIGKTLDSSADSHPRKGLSAKEMKSDVKMREAAK